MISFPIISFIFIYLYKNTRGSVSLCQSLNSYSEHQQQSSFRALHGVSLVFITPSHTSLKLYPTLMRFMSLTPEEIVGVTKKCETLLPILVQLP